MGGVLMDNRDKLSLLEKIEIEVSGKDKIETYYSRVEEIKDDSSTYLIMRPVSKGSYTYLFPGQELRVIFYRKDAKYFFDAIVLKGAKEVKGNFVEIGKVSDIQKLQRRDYFRLDIVVPVEVIIYDSDKNETKIRANTIDISGGGLKILSKYSLKESSNVDIKIQIPKINRKKIDAKVIRTIKSLNSEDMYETALEYGDIGINTRQEIISYIFSKQREILKKDIK
jgi:c-di-GMP-binding flagellar brake protein YcgR